MAVKEITKRVSDIQFDMVTLNLDSKQKPFEKIGNVNVYRIKTHKNLFPIKAFLLASKLHKEKHYDIVWSIMANYAGFATLFFKWRFKKVKFVLTLQEGATIKEMKRRVRFIRPLHRQIFRQADLIQCISRYLCNFAKEVNKDANVILIPNGVDNQLFANISDKAINNIRQKLDKKIDDIFLITTSRLSLKNGLEDVIRALPHLPPHVSFVVVGIGELEERLKTVCRELGVENRVKFIGFVPYATIPAYLHASNIFIRPSLSEGFGNSFIEAMAAGLTVIATPVGGIVDFLRDGETGLFCEVKNPESIARQVKRLMADESLRKSLIVKARKMVKQKYDWNLIAREMGDRVFNDI